MVLIFSELDGGSFKKTSQEAIFYASKLAQMTASEVHVLAVGDASESELAKAGNFGASKVYQVKLSDQANQSATANAKVLIQLAKQLGAKIIVSAKSSFADAVTARVAGALKACVASNVIDLPKLDGEQLIVKTSIFTGKAFAEVRLNSDTKIISIRKNTVQPEISQQSATVEILNLSVDEKYFAAQVIETIKASGSISLPEADLVVSGGRGMKGGEHWQPLLDLADALGAATACSKPVSDLDWRPHHEHVGQTGVKVSPNLYIACGISGAIQHLAGVNSSKVIVVINKDPEAPFFKAADYGIVGDVFEVLPKLTKAVLANK